MMFSGYRAMVVLETYLASSTTSTSAWAVIGALEWAARGSSAFSSPLVELTTWGKEKV